MLYFLVSIFLDAMHSTARMTVFFIFQIENIRNIENIQWYWWKQNWNWLISSSYDEESVGDLNKLSPVLLNNTCDFIPQMPSNAAAVDERQATPLANKAKKSRSNPIEWSCTVSVFDINCKKTGDSVIPEEVLSANSKLDLFLFFSFIL